MTDAIKNGMTLAMSNWGSTHEGMAWLDGDTGCQGDCDMPDVFFSNIEYTVSQPTPPAPGSGKWKCFAGDCFETQDGTFDS